MSLIYCPECGHEISNAAVACPNCGRPIQAHPVVERKVVANVVREKNTFPAWAFAPIVIGAGVLLLLAFLIFGRGDATGNENVSVNVASRRTVPDQRTDSREVTVPSTATTSTESQSVTVPGTQSEVVTPPPSKGTAVIEAKVAPRTGQPQPVKNARFYLLDKDVGTLLSDAHIEPIEGQSLENSIGLSILYPDRFGDFNRKAMRVIKEHTKYAGVTDLNGMAQLGGIEPDSYYLFGVIRSGNGFAMWSSPVSIIPGQNKLTLAPQSVTEMNISSE